MKFTKFPEPLKDIHRRLHDEGFSCYLVGGAVRSLLLRLPPKDWDLATDAEPRRIMKIFKRVVPTGIKHGTVTILSKGTGYEITTFRIEGKYSDARRPDTVEYTSSLLEDLKRRDFTVNAMAVDIGSGDLVDPHDGSGDCKRKIIRAIGIPKERFDEDGLRILRAVRFAGQLHFRIEPETLEGMKGCVSNLDRISHERVRDELEKIILTDRPSESFRLMADTGILDRILPELSACRGVEQKGNHRFDVYHHSLLSCDGAPGESIALRMAALFHDIGKPLVKTDGEDGLPRFHRHEEVSARTTSAIMKRLRFPLSLEKQVCHLIREHMFNYESIWTDAAVRRFVMRVGKENLEDLFALRLADQYGTRGAMPDPRSLDELRRRIRHVLSEDAALSLKDLRVNGNDLELKARIPKGPAMGRVLNFLLESVLEDPRLNERERLLEIAERFYRSRLNPFTPDPHPHKDPDR